MRPFDAAIASLVLCSVPDQDAALTELRRVLRPGGELRFYEHVLAHEPRMAALQRPSTAADLAARPAAATSHATPARRSSAPGSRSSASGGSRSTPGSLPAATTCAPGSRRAGARSLAGVRARPVLR